MSNSIDPSLLYSRVNTGNRSTPSNNLGKDAFLKILMTQLQNQDPLNPMEDKDFIAQMASFSSLEQMTNLNQTFTKFIDSQIQNQVISFHQFVGKDVTWHTIEYPKDKKADPIVHTGKGTIQSVQFVEGSAVFILKDGTKLYPENISEIHEPTSSQSSLVDAASLIGKKVSWVNKDKEEVTATVKAVSWKDGKVIYHLDDEQQSKITSSDITKIEMT